MHRLLSILGLAVVSPGAPTCGAAAGGAEVATTVYVPMKDLDSYEKRKR